MKNYLSQIATIILGNVIIAFAISNLLVENHIIVGGVSGLGVALSHFFPLPLSIYVGIFNIILFLLGFWVFGKEFAFKTIISTFSFPVALRIFEHLPKFFTGLEDIIIVSVLAGVFIGFGVGLIIIAGASTGGVDILALLLNKYFNRPVSLMLNIIDVIILSMQAPFNDISHVMYGIVTVMVTALVLNKTLTQGNGLLQVLIISDEYEKIREVILFQQDSGLTMISSEKGYTRNKSNILFSIIPYKKLPELKKAVYEIDKDAFIMVSQINEVRCKGTKQLRG